MKYTYFFLLGFAFCFAEDPIEVKLTTEEALIPFYLEATDGQNQPHLKVLADDLRLGGRVTLVDRKDAALIEGTLHVNEKQLNMTLSDRRNNKVQKIEGILLSGKLNEDRHALHQVSDEMHRALFGTLGVASTHILFTKRLAGADPKSEVWEVDYDGANARQVSKDGGYCVTPLYLPPKEGCLRSHFFYVSYRQGQPKIYFASLKDGKGVRFCALPGNQLLPAVSLQRDKVAFISDVGGNPDLFLQAFDASGGVIGKPAQIFTARLATQGSPTFRPDGKEVAFVSNKDGSPRIYLMEVPEPGASLKQLKPRLLTRANKESTAPSWSPDGKKIAYCSKTEGVRQIWLYDCDKNEERQLTHGPIDKENPTWAPDSRHLLYNSTGKGGGDLFMIIYPGAEPIKLELVGNGENRFPSWEQRSFDLN